MTKKKNATARWLAKKMESNTFRTAYEKAGKEIDAIVPLTGEADEWDLVSVQDGQPIYQNKRCSHVFMQGEEAYDIEGVVFWEWFTTSEGKKIKSHFTTVDSRVPVKFPYTPKRKYRERKEQRR